MPNQMAALWAGSRATPIREANRASSVTSGSQGNSGEW